MGKCHDSNGYFVWVGCVSFGIYVIHQYQQQQIAILLATHTAVSQEWRPFPSEHNWMLLKNNYRKVWKDDYKTSQVIIKTRF